MRTILSAAGEDGHSKDTIERLGDLLEKGLGRVEIALDDVHAACRKLLSRRRLCAPGKAVDLESAAAGEQRVHARAALLAGCASDENAGGHLSSRVDEGGGRGRVFGWQTGVGELAFYTGARLGRDKGSASA
jgi:hypothetical protein